MFKCDICNKPVILLTLLSDGVDDKDYNSDGPPIKYFCKDDLFGTQEHSGPTVYPDIKDWCDGKCIADVIRKWAVWEEEDMAGRWEDDGGAINGAEHLSYEQ